MEKGFLVWSVSEEEDTEQRNNVLGQSGRVGYALMTNVSLVN
jgi:hypothetical protein